MNSVIIVFPGSWLVAAVEDGYPRCQNASASSHLGLLLGCNQPNMPNHTRSHHQLGLLRKNSTKMLVKVEECTSFSDDVRAYYLSQNLGYSAVRG